MRCDDCVRLFGTLDGQAAVCGGCGALCQPYKQGFATPQGMRGGAIETHTDRRKRILRDWIVPPHIIVWIGLVHVALVAQDAGWATAALISVGWLAAATAWMAFAWWLGYKIISLPLENVPIALLKIAAVTVALHSLRMGVFAVVNPQMPTGFFDVFTTIVQLAICFAIVPMLVLMVSLRTLFAELTISEWIYAVAGLYLADALLMAIALMAILN